jgi:serine/threonine-protein kinase
VALAAGTRLGAYEIVSLIGSGGMGEVYRARDIKLGRDVALKILPEAFVREHGRVARFDREAHVLASLNHPNIGAIYGVDEAQGQTFLILELVDGETLASRIRKGRLAIDEALRIAIQVAGALEAAHDKGIVHRDLKPGNIALTKSGLVKVLDFGLAKTLEPDIDISLESLPSSTLTSPAVVTRAGVILGTAAYMSPEQALGKPVDRRTDLWSFGVVLFEMLSGKPAFAGETVSLVIACVLKSEPDWSCLPSETAPSIRRTLRRCLQKDARKRLDSAAAAGLDIEEAVDGPERGDVRASRVSLKTVSFALSLAAVLVSGIFWMAARASVPQIHPLRRWTVSIPDNQAYVDIPSNGVEITTDGSAIVYSGRGLPHPQLYYRRLDRLEGTPLPGTDDACCPALSPSGDWVAFSVNHVLYKVSVHGGPAIQLATVTYECGPTWASEDVIYYAQGNNRPLLRIPANGGAATSVAFPPTGTGFCMPVALVGTDLVLVWNLRRIAVVNTSNGNVRPIDGAAMNPIGVSRGFVAFGRPDGILGVAPFDPERTTSVASMLPVDDRPHMRNSGMQASLSDAGELAYVRATNRTRLALLDAQGRVIRTSDADHNLIGPRLSPGGRLIVAGELSDSTDRGDLWLFDRESSVLQRLTTDGASFSPQWMPDGRGVIYRHPGPRGIEILLMPIGRSGRPNVLMSAKPGQIRELVVGPDLRHAVVTVNDQTSNVGGSHIQAVDLGDQSAVAFEPVDKYPPGSQMRPAISPDGRWLAYESSESGREEIFVRPFPDAGPAVRVTAAGGLDPRWMADSRTVVYRTGTGQFVAAHLSFDRGVPHVKQQETLFSFFTGISHTGDDTIGRYDIGLDGTIVALQPASGSDIIVVQGWLDDVKRRGPK